MDPVSLLVNRSMKNFLATRKLLKLVEIMNKNLKIIIKKEKKQKYPYLKSNNEEIMLHAKIYAQSKKYKTKLDKGDLEINKNKTQKIIKKEEVIKKNNFSEMNIHPRTKRQGSFSDLNSASKKTKDNEITDDDLTNDDEVSNLSIDTENESDEIKLKTTTNYQQQQTQQQRDNTLERPKRKYAKRKGTIVGNQEENQEHENRRIKKAKPQSIKEQKRILEENEKEEIRSTVRNEKELIDEEEIDVEVNRRLRIRNMERKNNIPLYIVTNKNKQQYRQDFNHNESTADHKSDEKSTQHRSQLDDIQLDLNTNHTNTLERNHELELKYNRDKYSVVIHGNNIEDYSANIFDRLDELKRCVGVLNPGMILPIVDKDTEVMSLKVTVNNYHDYLKLIGKWPTNAFKSGVNVEPLPYNLTVVISNVDKDINITSSDTRIRQTEKVYGLTNFERIRTRDNKPTTKLKAQAKSISDYIEVLKKGIYLGITSKRHHVTPNIIYPNVCKKCGNLSHREKECNNEACCLKCGKKQHTKSECEAYCTNCTGPHPCNSELCHKIVEKTYSLNKYTLEILLGESIIKKKEEILKVPRSILDEQTLPLNADDKNLEKYIENYISKRMTDIDIKINSIKEANNLNKKEIDEIKNDLGSVKKDLVDVKNDLGNLNGKLDGTNLKIDQLNRNQNETKAGIDELKAILLATAKGNIPNKQ
ncbi:unnamed protein product [Brachionus calyciflorus]|uniref:CCHC-type domain-containing protein n=1 Tax=Brachionus calyciflorus TaxID=104777 RepID=A0A814D0N2_9BILA|nr:unnamed protein product [Brachionus calyciflorus]